MSREKPIVGTQYGCYTVISDEVGVKDRKSYYLVKCSCGREQYVRSDVLKRSQAKRCRYCANHINYDRNVALGLIDHKGYSEGKHRGCGDLTLTFLYKIKLGAKARGIEWSDRLTVEYLWNLFLEQGKKCALSGLDISLKGDFHIPVNNSSRNLDYTTFTASLDRIDSYKPYEVGNVQWVHRNINIMKNSFSQEYFIQMCNLVSHANQQPSPIIAHENYRKGSETTEVNSANKNPLQENPPSSNG